MSANKVDLDFERDIVYVPCGATDDTFENVRALFKVGPQRLIITIVSERGAEKPDLKNITHIIADTILKKMKIDLFNDCDVYYEERGRRFRVKYAGGDGTVAALVESVLGEEL